MDNNDDSPVEAVGSLFDQLAPVQALLEAITVPDRIEIEDLYGNQHTFRPVLSARRQLEASVRMARVWDQLQLEIDGIRAEVQALLTQSGETVNYPKILQHVLAHVAASETMAAELHDLFATLHPKILATAQAGGSDDHVLDLFELDAIVAALIPFFARAVTSLSRRVAAMAPQPAGNTPPPKLSAH